MHLCKVNNKECHDYIIMSHHIQKQRLTSGCRGCMLGTTGGDANMHDDCVYTVQDVADLLKVSTKTIYNMIRAGELDVIRVRGQIRIASCALDTYISRGGSPIAEKHPRELVP